MITAMTGYVVLVLLVLAVIAALEISNRRNSNGPAAGPRGSWVADDRDVLLASYDIAGSGPLGAMTSTTGPFAVALVLSPRAEGAASRLDITPERGNVGAEAIGDPWLDALVASNPAAHAVPLMHALALMRPTALRVPAARGLDLHIDIGVVA